MAFQKLKAILKDLLPPFIQRAIGSFIWVRWDGDYPSWAAAAQKTTGYHTPIIFEKVRAAMLKVKSGQAACERDSLVFDEVKYSYPLLAVLNYVARQGGNRLNVLDFGGSMGTSYFQNRAMLSGLTEFHWCIVEQKHFVEEGRRSFSDEHLHFYDSIEEVFSKHSIQLVLLSGVLQFLEEPWDFLDTVLAHGPEYLMIDRATLMNSGPDRLTIQTVPKSLYEATYPCWLLNKQALWDRICRDYDLILSGDVPEKINIRQAAFYFGFFKRKAQT